MIQRSKFWLFYALAWLPAALFYGIAVGARAEVRFVPGMLTGLIEVGMAAVIGIAIWWLSGRLPLSASPLRLVAVHAVSAAVYAGTWVAITLGTIYIVAPREIADRVMREAGLWQFLTGLFLYSLVAGISYLLRSQRALRERSTAAALAEASAARAQLQAVHNQLQPHFLFNALHAVTSIVREDPIAAERALEQLGDLLRYALDHGRQDLVPLSAEMSFARDYLALEQLRLGDRLSIDMNVADNALQTMVPPFLIQPLVENAVRHGIASSACAGIVRIDALRNNGRLEISIADNGAGADTTTMTRAGGLGLEGVRRQLDARYNGTASVKIDSAPDRGFTVHLSLPA
jgi:LytS/YehU family sensor histidine kinase